MMMGSDVVSKVPEPHQYLGVVTGISAQTSALQIPPQSGAILLESGMRQSSFFH